MSTNDGPSADTKKKNTLASAVGALTRKGTTDSAIGPQGLGDKFRKLAKVRMVKGDSRPPETYVTGTKNKATKQGHFHS